eukprot:TRINITY_DN20976_c0_g1_i2.p1 TRINITY_DN20976_c0_g1~~TRINITY_DN20976_c0_g1_i2.p1  ORF type:complete len:669 (+),score=115.28 TRINITY_DN20976_c0_g1_i2:95-2101(+)
MSSRCRLGIASLLVTALLTAGQQAEQASVDSRACDSLTEVCADTPTARRTPDGAGLAGTCTFSVVHRWLERLRHREVAALTPTVWAANSRIDVRSPRWSDYMADVVKDYDTCTRRLGGRLWMADVVFRGNFTDVEGDAVTDPNYPNYAPRSACVPWQCSTKRAVQGVLVPVFWLLTLSVAKRMQRLLDDEQRIMPVRASRSYMRQVFQLAPSARRGMGELFVAELGSWEELDLSWAILGFEGCGTTSLAKSLHAHPQLETLFVAGNPYYESNFFWADWPQEYRLTEPNIQNMVGRHLLFKTEVNLFNSWRTKAPAAHQRLRGIKSAKYVHDDVSLRRLALIPKLKVLVLVEDPVVRIERGYLKNVAAMLMGACDGKTACSEQPLVPALADCLERPCGVPLHYNAPGFYDWRNDLLREQGLNIERGNFSVSGRLQEVVRLFGSDRVLVAARSDLQEGRQLFDRIAAWFGVESFSDAAVSTAIGNKGHHAGGKSTKALREDILNALGPGSSERHEETLAMLQDFFSGERRALRDLLVKLRLAELKATPAGDLLARARPLFSQESKSVRRLPAQLAPKGLTADAVSMLRRHSAVLLCDSHRRGALEGGSSCEARAEGADSMQDRLCAAEWPCLRDVRPCLVLQGRLLWFLGFQGLTCSGASGIASLGLGKV